MTIAFADSNFYVALLIARDSNHAKAKAIAQTWTGNVVTTDYVLIEVANHLSGTPQHRARFGQLLADLSRPKYADHRIVARLVAARTKPLFAAS
jgi:predicted nucleic acid-binding protein